MQYYKSTAPFFNPYVSIPEAISDLHERGYSADFNVIGNRLFCSQTKSYLKMNEFEVLEVYRFEDGLRTRGESIVYGIEGLGIKIKGILFQTSLALGSIGQDILTQKIRKFWK